eukprot:362301-Chlamydomonas_euryale.AAC.6
MSFRCVLITGGKTGVNTAKKRSGQRGGRRWRQQSTRERHKLLPVPLPNPTLRPLTARRGAPARTGTPAAAWRGDADTAAGPSRLRDDGAMQAPRLRVLAFMCFVPLPAPRVRLSWP